MNNVAHPVIYQDKMIIVTKMVSLLLDYQDKMIQLVERLFSHRCDVPVRKVGESDKNKKKWENLIKIKESEILRTENQ